MLSLGLVLSALAMSTARAVDPTAAEAGLQALSTADLRVATITFRLAAANIELCKDQAPLSGLSLHDASQYDVDYRPAAVRLFGLGKWPGVMAIVPGGPADRAGLRSGDALLAINGVAIPAAPDDQEGGSAPASYDRMARILEQFDAALAGGPVTLTVARAGAELKLRLAPVTGCASRSQLLPDDKRDAGADGRMISITTAMVDFARNDDELAVVISHEMAHNAMRHRQLLDAQGVSRGLLSHFGANARKIRATEQEADRLGLYMMARAGFDIMAAPAFWRRFGKATDFGPLSDATHPRGREREQAMLGLIGDINAKRASGQPLVPGASARP
jgi:hypothetical protein